MKAVECSGCGQQWMVKNRTKKCAICGAPFVGEGSQPNMADNAPGAVNTDEKANDGGHY